MEETTRRQFIKTTTCALGAVPFLHSWPTLSQAALDGEGKLPIYLFSKHLQFLDYRTAGEKAAEMGFAGLDLTVRPGGHVLPENVAEDLPKAIAEIKKGGSKCHLMTTAVDNAHDALDAEVLKVASQQGITHYRCNWLRYDENRSMPDTLKEHAQIIKSLSELNRSLGLKGCYQNHSGTWVGASIWEIKTLLEKADKDYFGAQYDIRHAMVEGGLSWENGLRLIKDHIKSIAIKDYKWEKIGGRWKVMNVPLGEGMVDFKKYFGLLKKYKINVPVILHAEYPLGGASHGKSEISVAPEVVFTALQKDLKKAEQLWEEA
ncbi:TIM barrel protein [Ulvibacterium sp.]|uniref:sugar phosphate isomerase/epimerase family protein n=1 Tax=Ulvibacterium sp. TaxID=2665914 RepID=UPI00262AD15A|nr:TIM barrel protein [Ulvibacterium sp.]